MTDERVAVNLTFPRSVAMSILLCDHQDFTIIEDEIVDTRRWSIDHCLIVQQVSTGKYYRAFYSRGATESQDERPWEYEDEVEFEEVRPVEKTVIIFETF